MILASSYLNYHLWLLGALLERKFLDKKCEAVNLRNLSIMELFSRRR